MTFKLTQYFRLKWELKYEMYLPSTWTFCLRKLFRTRLGDWSADLSCRMAIYSRNFWVLPPVLIKKQPQLEQLALDASTRVVTVKWYLVIDGCGGTSFKCKVTVVELKLSFGAPYPLAFAQKLRQILALFFHYLTFKGLIKSEKFDLKRYKK